jgi:predicted  nucleic acid-binding Zn-ribbon protein
MTEADNERLRGTVSALTRKLNAANTEIDSLRRQARDHAQERHSWNQGRDALLLRIKALEGELAKMIEAERARLIEENERLRQELAERRANVVSQVDDSLRDRAELALLKAQEPNQ